VVDADADMNTVFKNIRMAIDGPPHA
jgi:hypothetical protein